MKVAKYIVATTALAASAPAFAEDWLLVSANEKIWNFVDKDSVTANQFWFGVVYLNDRSKPISKIRVEYRCPNREYRFVHLVVYNGELVPQPHQNRDSNASWVPAVPGSHISAAIEYVCDGGEASSESVPSLEELWEFLKSEGKA